MNSEFAINNQQQKSIFHQTKFWISSPKNGWSEIVFIHRARFFGVSAIRICCKQFYFARCQKHIVCGTQREKLFRHRFFFSYLVPCNSESSLLRRSIPTNVFAKNETSVAEIDVVALTRLYFACFSQSLRFVSSMPCSAVSLLVALSIWQVFLFSLSRIPVL